MRPNLELSATSEARAPVRVLVADDDPDIREMLMMALSSHGMEVTCASNGDEALSALRAATLLPQVILLDLRMRGGMGGAEFMAEHHADAALAAVPVVIMTALDGVEQRATGLQAAAWLTKPLRLRELLALLAKVIANDAVPAVPAA